MSDDRLVRLLRTIDDPVDSAPAFLDTSFEALARELGFRRRQRRHGPIWWLAAAVLLAALVTATVAVGALVWERLRPNLLSVARETGTIGVAISRDYPQVMREGGGFDGFDVAVATDMTQRMGLRPEITPVIHDAIVAGGDWTMAFPSAPVDRDGRWASSQPYYYWPLSVVVSTDSPAASIGDLRGATICAVAGSGGEAWLEANTDLVPLAHADDQACLDALARGTAQAAITAELGPADIQVRGDVRALGPPVLFESRSALVDREAGDPGALLSEINLAIRSARDDGTLGDLSRRYFGGHDLTVAPAEQQESSR